MYKTPDGINLEWLIKLSFGQASKITLSSSEISCRVDTRSLGSTYISRQSQNFSIPKCRLNILKIFLFPLDSQHGMPLEIEIRKSSTLKSFKNNFQPSISQPQSYFSYELYWNIIHTSLCRNCILKKDLYKCKIIDCPLINYYLVKEQKMHIITFYLV